MTADTQALTPSIAAQMRRLARSRATRRLGRHRLFLIGFTIFTAFLAVALLADVISPADPNLISVRHRFRPPGGEFLLGTDNFGRDILSRILHGARVSLLVGFAVALMTTFFGVILGAAAGYFRRLDAPVVGLMDAFMAFPTILLAIGISTALGPSLLNAVIALTIVYIPRTARIVRASVIVVREAEYVHAASACGASHWWILRHHVLPNSLAPLIVQVSFIFAYAILAEAILSFLGLGPPPPTISWGTMIAEGRQYIRTEPHLCLFPGLTIAITVLGLNLLGDGLRDVLDPRMHVEHS